MTVDASTAAKAIVPPRAAATGILLRESGSGTEVLFQRRSEGLAFMGGAWVYPGGKVDPADGSAEVLARCRMRQREALPVWHDVLGRPVPPEAQLSFLVATCREIFEETGILALRERDGSPCRASLANEWQAQRRAVSQEASRFVAMMERADLWLDPSDYLHWANWITPSAAPRRFDTRFFVVQMPPGQEASCDEQESCALHWLPIEGLGEASPPDEAMISAPPTRTTLIELAEEYRDAGNADRLFVSRWDRACVPVMPKMKREDGQLVAVLPWDREYEALPGEGISPLIEMPARLRRLPSRIIARHEIRAPAAPGAHRA